MLKNEDICKLLLAALIMVLAFGFFTVSTFIITNFILKMFSVTFRLTWVQALLIVLVIDKLTIFRHVKAKK